MIVNGQNTKLDVNSRSLAVSAMRGFVFHDFNDNGLQESNEPPLGNIAVFLDTNHDGRRDAGEAWVNTTDTGTFLFSSLPRGAYDVTLDLPSACARRPVNKTV